MQVYSDGKVHVCKKMCDTCIFRSGNPMQLQEGRVEQMVKDATSDEMGAGTITCHDTIYKGDDIQQAVCRGYFDRHAGGILQIAERLGIIEYV